jgi:hypothetical protein
MKAEPNTQRCYRVLTARGRPCEALLSLPDDLLATARVALRNLADHPRPAGVIPVLVGWTLALRLELPGCWICYEVDDEKRVVEVFAVGVRRWPITAPPARTPSSRSSSPGSPRP